MFITQSTQNHETHSLGEFKDDQIQNHTHTRGTMEITGRDDIAWSGVHNGAVNNSFRKEGAFTGLERYSSDNNYIGNGRDTIGQITVPVGISFKASNGWTGSTSNPSGRGGDTTHGKQIGVRYIIKVL